MAEFNLDNFSIAKASFERANSFGEAKAEIVKMIDKCDAKIATKQFISNQLNHDESTAAESQQDP
jgi:23S rRNA maturation-related 3'-5' exoribonuclease YhaM